MKIRSNSELDPTEHWDFNLQSGKELSVLRVPDLGEPVVTRDRSFPDWDIGLADRKIGRICSLFVAQLVAEAGTAGTAGHTDCQIHWLASRQMNLTSIIAGIESKYIRLLFSVPKNILCLPGNPVIIGLII